MKTFNTYDIRREKNIQVTLVYGTILMKQITEHYFRTASSS